MPAGDYIEGLALFAAMLAGTLGGAAWITARRIGGLRGCERALAFTVVATLGILAVHLVPLLLGILSRFTVIVATLAWVGASVLLGRRTQERSPADVPAPDRDDAGRAGRAVAGLSLGLLLALLAASLSEHLTEAPLSIDVLNFHLPNVARWIETGSIWQIDVFLPDVAPGHYPQNGDVLLLAAVLPWRDDFLAHLVMYPYWALTGIAVYALVCRIGGARSAAIVAASAVLFVPAVAAPALGAGLVDALVLFGFAVGLLFLARHRETGARSDLMLAGLALGVAFGTKWYGVWAVAIVLAVWVAGSYAERREARTLARDGALVGGLVLLAGGVWLLRNLVESGNPFFPVRLEPFGLTIFDAPPDVVRETAGFSLLDYLGDGSVWSDSIWPQLRRTLAGPGILIGAGFLVAVAVAVRSRGAADRRRLALAGAVTALLLLVAYLATPYSAGGPEGFPFLVAADARYAAPALLAAAIVAGAYGGVVTWIAAALAVAAPFAFLDGARWSLGAYVEAAGLNPFTWGLAAVVGLGVALAWPTVRDRADEARGRVAGAGVAPVATAVATAAVGLAAAGYIVQERFNDSRFAGADPTTDWIREHAPGGARVGLAAVWDDVGVSPVLPAFGPRYENDVAYVGEWDDDMLRRYRDSSAFAEALARGGFDLLFIGKGRYEAPDVPEQEWAREAGFVPVAESDRLTLLAAPTSP